MKIESVYDPSFALYGKVLEGYDTAELIDAMHAIPLPETGTAYEPGIDSLEACAIYTDLRDRGYGGMPIELGMCWGHNTKLNCLEYHRDSEINIGSEDFILLLAKQYDIENGLVDSEKVRAFRVPAGVPIEVYATTLHYAPCHTDVGTGFRVAVALPKGTNTELPAFTPKCAEDRRMTARNKWLLPHPESAPAKNGVPVGIKGINIDISDSI